MKLNEDFFDDFSDNELIDNPVGDFIEEPVDDSNYTYNVHFIIYVFPFIKDIIGKECVYYFEDPKYKPIVESAFLSMKKTLDYILQASSIVIDYSEPKFCSSTENIIETFPFMDNNQSNEFEIKFSDNHFITLKTSINLSRRKNTHNLTKFFYSFWRLQQIYNNLISTNKFNKHIFSAPYINIGVYKNNPYEKSNLSILMNSDKELTSDALELINFLNDKDETDK